MQPFRRILVGIDLFAQSTLDTQDITEASRQAVDQAIWLARKLNAELRFHAVLPGVMNPHAKYVPDWYTQVGAGANVQQYRDEAAAAVRELAERATQQQCTASSHIGYGDPWLELIRTAVESDSDLILVGSRDQGGASRLFIGSTAVKLIRNAPMAVWITHPRQAVEVNSVLAATDFSDTAGRAVTTALQVAAGCGAGLQLVHACHEGPETRMWGGQRSPAQREEAHRAVLGEAQGQMDLEVQRLRDAGTAVEVTGHVKWGDVGEAVRQAAVDQNVNLLVLGSVGRTGLAGVLLGNSAERVLREVDRSLLVVKPDGFECPVAL